MSTLFRNIVQQVTQEKLEELKVQEQLSKTYFNPVLKEIDQPSTTPTAALQLLFQAINECPLKSIVDSILLENLKYVLQNEKDDPSISSQLLQSWVDKVKQEIKFSLRKFEYSYLYGSLLSEWLEAEELKNFKSVTSPEVVKSLDPKNSLKKAAINEEVATDSIKELMFNQPDGFSVENFNRFLAGDVFNFDQNLEGQNVMKAFQKETKTFFQVNQFVITTYDVQYCITGLRSMDLLSLEKKSALDELHQNSEALAEVASLLTNRLKNIERWEWPASSKSVEVRRGIAGVYKPYLNEDLITALLLQYVGVQWASYFKRQFLSIYRSKAWTKVEHSYHSIESERRNFYERTFLSELPDSMSSQEKRTREEYVKIGSAASSEPQRVSGQHPGIGGAQPGIGGSQPGFGSAQLGGLSYAREYDRSELQVGSGSAYPGYSSYPGASGTGQSTSSVFPAPGAIYQPITTYPGQPYQPNYYPHSPGFPPIPTTIDFKQAFLHTLSTEIRLNQVIHSDKPFVIVQADLESFGPNIIHDAVLAVFEYFGVSAQWIGFFKKFLQPKVSFGKEEEPKQVVRGVPTSHVLSSLFEETLLFLLDFYVNQKCNGIRIYRVDSEFWFWNDEYTSVTKAWDMMTRYGKVIGLKINENRSGSVAVYSDELLPKVVNSIDAIVAGPSPLPQNHIRWGYLQLCSNGTFTIDQEAIKKFLDEMKDLLDKSECVLEWINIFNKYLEFFIRNFGKAAVVSGKKHLDQIIDSLQIIYEGLFGSKDGSPVDKLKERFEQLKSADIVDVWAYWPLERGGLGLVNPFIGVMSLREAYADINDEDNFSKIPLQDQDLWNKMRDNYALTQSWAQYTASRETQLSHWYYRYIRLLERPAPKTLTVSERFWKLDAPIPRDENGKNYMMWLFSYYENQLILHFGSVRFINSKLLPMSMIADIQKSKVHQ